MLRSRSHSKTHRQDRGSSCQAWGQTRPSVPHFRATMALESGATLTSCPQASGLEDPPVPFSQALLSLKYSQLSAGARAGSSGARGGATGTLQVPNRGSTPGGARHREGRLDGPNSPAKHPPRLLSQGTAPGTGTCPLPMGCLAPASVWAGAGRAGTGAQRGRHLPGSVGANAGGGLTDRLGTNRQPERPSAPPWLIKPRQPLERVGASCPLPSAP